MKYAHQFAQELLAGPNRPIVLPSPQVDDGVLLEPEVALMWLTADETEPDQETEVLLIQPVTEKE